MTAISSASSAASAKSWVTSDRRRRGLGERRAELARGGARGCGVERRERLVEQQHAGSRASARASATRWRSPPRELAGERVGQLLGAEARAAARRAPRAALGRGDRRSRRRRCARRSCAGTARSPGTGSRSRARLGRQVDAGVGVEPASLAERDPAAVGRDAARRSIRSTVVLPAPEGPTSARHSPGARPRARPRARTRAGRSRARCSSTRAHLPARRRAAARRPSSFTASSSAPETRPAPPRAPARR